MPVITFDQCGIAGGLQLGAELRVGELYCEDVLHDTVTNLIPVGGEARLLLAHALCHDGVLDLGVFDLCLLGVTLLSLESRLCVVICKPFVLEVTLIKVRKESVLTVEIVDDQVMCLAFCLCLLLL